MSENAAVASAAVTARYTEHFGVFLALYAQKNNLSMPHMTTSMLPALSVEPLDMDDSLLVEEPDVGDVHNKTLNNAMDAALREGDPYNAQSAGSRSTRAQSPL